MRIIYLSITQLLNLTVLHIGFSVASGVLINLITAAAFPTTIILAIVFNIVALVFLGILIHIRTRIDWDFNAREDEKLTADVRWANAADFGEKSRVRWFFGSIGGFLCFFVAGLILMFMSGFQNEKADQLMENALKEKEAASRLRTDSARQATEIRYLQELLKKATSESKTSGEHD